jgi:hypothetical protein
MVKAPPSIESIVSAAIAFMDAAEKGARYARVFRKAGVLLGKGRIARAIQVLEEGRAMAEKWGDTGMARRFATEIARANTSSESSE